MVQEHRFGGHMTLNLSDVLTSFDIGKLFSVITWISHLSRSVTMIK